MVSKTSLRETVRGFHWEQLRTDLAARPDLLEVRDERGRNWLHLCCATPGGAADESIRTADLLLELGLGLEDPAFTEGEWRATPLWFAISRGRNLALAEHLLTLGSTPRYSMFAAVWNEDREAIRLLLRHGAPVDEDTAPGETPLLGAVAWSKFGPAEELLAAGANPDFRNPKGETGLHLMLKKGSPIAALRLFARHGARGDIPDAKGRTAAMILRRKRDPAFRALADELATA
ncbi:MAG TPA: hypothetical protein VMG08_20500 [Allosphingosinicella sp.]|nr:hypothetical protein [Allosphingosinicella sp.]